MKNYYTYNSLLTCSTGVTDIDGAMAEYARFCCSVEGMNVFTEVFLI